RWQLPLDDPLTTAAVLDELALDVGIRPNAVRQAGGALVGAPGDVALADARHDLAQGQGEVRVGPAAEPPHADDAQRRLVERNGLVLRGMDRFLPARFRPDGGEELCPQPGGAAPQGFQLLLVAFEVSRDLPVDAYQAVHLAEAAPLARIDL